MHPRNALLLLFFFLKFHSYEGCTSAKNKVNLPCKEYDLSKPYILKLGDALTEISGIYFYPKDSSVFAISDEYGNLYKIKFNENYLTEKWKFDKTHDFEDVLLHDGTFYVLESNGNIDALNFSAKGDTIFNRKSKFPGNDKKKNEFESLYYDSDYNKIIMICKDCEDDKKNTVSSWAFDPSNDHYILSQFLINTKTIAEKLGEEKIKLKPSAATINPVTKDVWILASTNQLLIVTDNKGNTKEVYTLDPVIFNQPEGISFTPWGDLIISNEAGDKYGTASLLIFKPKKRV
ncbi:hypothetical protein FW778_01010 [Ginsengibacter hankyongi]|uniref:SdiA-regulated n=1 Tax=Ginsengibacter hankyongi TaxID=2607284 RepID=A0A5J5II11_9BACT|nr:SdiA-regulated domain-containing protein [Ginsengibacter hankyongi]KAA9040650.1 hypothetical protein FW778_01010 [Ginsengibacter hankyongi]